MKTDTLTTADVAAVLNETAGSGRRLPWRRLAAAAVLLLLILAAVRFATRGGEAAPAYVTAPTVRGGLSVTVSATGTLEPTDEVEVGSELSGIVETVEADFNDRVTVGQVLVRLDTSKLEAQVTQSRAALASAQAKVRQAEATVTEAGRKLEQLRTVWEASGHKAPSRTELDAAVAALDRAQADKAAADAAVAQARAGLDGNLTDMTKSVITSPIDGVVLSRDIEPGQTVAASFTAPVLFTLAVDLRRMDLHVDVDEADIGQVREGQDVSFTVAAYPERTFDGVITEVRYAPSTSSGVVTYETVISVDNADLSLRPGMTATADITVLSVEDAVLIPRAALRFQPTDGPAPPPQEKGSLINDLLPGPPRRDDRNQRPQDAPAGPRQQVWVLRDGRPEPIPVEIGATSGGYAELVSGELEAGVELLTGTTGAGGR